MCLKFSDITLNSDFEFDFDFEFPSSESDEFESDEYSLLLLFNLFA
tara:strand:- start:203 stop:340 length:138 start_codon:yes stop_codon:yes gene_type:complete